MDPLPNITELSAQTLPQHIKLNWKCALGIDVAYVCLRDDEMPTGSDDVYAQTKKVSRTHLAKSFGYVLERPTAEGTLFVRVFSAKNFETGWKNSDGEAEDCQLEIPLGNCRCVLYDVPKPFRFLGKSKRDTAELRITSDTETVLPELYVYCRPASEGPHLSPKDGPPHAIIPEGEMCSAEKPLFREVELPMTGTELVWRIFIPDPDVAKWMNILPKAGRMSEVVREASMKFLQEIG